MKRILAGIGGGLASMALLCAVIFLLCSHPALMAENMLSVTDPEKTGLPAEEVPGVCRLITGYLTGSEPVFQYVFQDADGTYRQCFSGKEQAHMADCRKLVLLDGRVCLLSLCAAMALAFFFLRKETRGAFGMGLLVMPALAICGAVFVASDFSGAFILFHRLAFDNELWLLSRQTDLLIRLMPTEFFVRCSVEGMIFWLVAVLLSELILNRGLKHAKTCAHSGTGKLL